VTAPAPIPLQPEDLAILALESETVVGHACKVVLVGDGAPGLEELRRAIAGRLDRAPALTLRLSEVGGRPSWVPDEAFDLAAHVVASPVAEPLDEAGLRREVARLFAERLDRAHPLWRIDVAPLEGGGRALVWRTHHALADGTATMRYARALLWDGEPDATAPGHGLRAAATDDARRRGHLVAFLRREFGRSGGPSPFDGTIGTRRRVAFAALPLGPLHRCARESCAGTVNDAVLAVVSGGIRRWLAARGGDLGDLRLRVPVSLHHEGDDAANRDSFFSIAVPLGEPDPYARLRAVRAATEEAKAGRDAQHMDAVLGDLGRVSPGLRRLVARVEESPRRFAVAVSNVVGPREPVAVLGAPVRGLYSLAEIGERHALRVGAVSLADALNLGLCADPGIVDDVEGIAAGAEAEARALIEAA
jgi:diacylglycerol O-acyltransferase / wax synthase